MVSVGHQELLRDLEPQGAQVPLLEVGGVQTPQSVTDAFKSVWFGGAAPAGLQIGTYTGAGVGLSTTADAVNLFDSTGAVQAIVLLVVARA